MSCANCGAPFLTGQTECAVCGVIAANAVPPPPIATPTNPVITPPVGNPAPAPVVTPAVNAAPATQQTPTVSTFTALRVVGKDILDVCWGWIKTALTFMWSVISVILVVVLVLLSLYGVYKGNPLIILFPLGLLPLCGKWSGGALLYLRLLAFFLLEGFTVAIYIAQFHRGG